MNVIEYALASQDARLAALKAQAQVPTVAAFKAATLEAIKSVETDPVDWCYHQDVLDAVRLAWSRLEAG